MTLSREEIAVRLACADVQGSSLPPDKDRAVWAAQVVATTDAIGAALTLTPAPVAPPAPTPSPEAKRPTHVRVTRLAHSDRPATVGKVYEVVRWNYDGSPDVIGDNGSNMSLSKPDGSDEKVWPAWEPAHCPPPVAGSDVTPVAPWINDAANAIMREVKAVADPDDDLDDPEDYAALRGAIEGIIQRAAPTVRP